MTQQSPTAEIYDFRRPTTLAREHARILDTHLSGFTRQVATQLTNRFNTKVTASLEDLRVHSYDRWTASLPSATVMVLAGFPTLESHAVFRIDESTAMHWISLMTGGPAVPVDTEARRKFSPTDIALIQNTINGFIEDLYYSLGAFLEPDMSVSSTHFSPQMAQAAKPNDLVVCSEVLFENGHSMSLAIPASALLPRMGNANPSDNDQVLAAGLAENLAHVPVEISLQISGTTMTAAQIMQWTEGTEILLPHPRQQPMNVVVGHQKFAQALSTKRGVRAAMSITKNEEGTR